MFDVENFDERSMHNEHNFDRLIVGFIGETIREKY